ncbi:MAG TPA: acyloxyacyl hydrolase [Bacteroidia bacterium]|jgi:hypothetical protein
MRKKVRILLCFLLLYLVRPVASQTVNTDYFLSGNLHYGFIIPHHGSLMYLINGHTPGMGFTYTRPTHGEKKWQRDYHYPEIGLTFFYISFGNPQMLGSGISVYPFINFHVTHNRRLDLRFKAILAPAPGFVTKKFDRLENHKNTVLGTHVNGYAGYRLIAIIPVGKNLRLETGIGISHFSNGGTRLPNLGINIPTAELGLAYHFNNKNVQLIPDTSGKSGKQNSFSFHASTGFTSINPPGQKEYPAYNLSAQFERQVSNKSKWLAGTDLVFNSSHLAEYRSDTIVHLHSDLQNLQWGIKGGYELVMGQLSFPMEMGIYLYSINTDDRLFFHRLGIRYHFNEHWSAAVCLKLHWANASYFEWGVGYNIKAGKKK